MRRAALAVLALLPVACTSHLEMGERRYRDGDRIGALEIWRAVGEDDSEYPDVSERIAVLEDEFEQLVVRYIQRGRYFEARGRLAESILDYRLALALRPDDAETLTHVQALARTLADRKAELTIAYDAAFETGNLATARQRLEELRALDAFDPALETEERQLHDALRDEISRRLAAGRAGFSAGNHTAAQRSFHATLELDPQNESARGYLSYIATISQEARESGEPPAAFEVSQQFASDAQIRAEGFYQNAIASERAGDLYAAIRHDQRALRADSEHTDARAHLSGVRARLADDVDRLIEAGRAAFREEDLQSALDLWRQALLIEPENERTQAYIARAERQLENLERMRADPDGAFYPR
jgi:tetratricopeptide (TPR) repeat protein